MIREKFYKIAYRSLNKRRLIFVALLLLFATIGAIAIVNIIAIERSYAVSRKEYEELRQYAPQITATDAPSRNAVPTAESTPDLAAINPDYIGWILIEGTNIDYPIVQGTDNIKYLTTTFSGERNPSGTIFMDSRCTDGFSGFVILHGHNMKDGSMFAGLHNYLKSDFLDEHTEIIIIIPDGTVLTYRIFDVKLTDVFDAAYTLFGNSDERILVLSTCTDSGDNNARLLVLATIE